MGNLRLAVYKLLEQSPDDQPLERFFEFALMALIILNVVAVSLETIHEFQGYFVPLFEGFEAFSVLIFTTEYMLRIWSCTIDRKYRGPIMGRLRFALTPLALVDLLAILPFYLPMLISVDLRFLRALRLLRLIRLMKIGRYSHSISLLQKVLNSKKNELLVGLFVAFVLLLVSSGLMYVLEHDAQPTAFSSIPAAMWWAVITFTTVGYGDLYPVTPLGKFFGAITAVLGIGFFALPAGIIASGFAEQMQHKGLTEKCPNCGHSLRE